MANILCRQTTVFKNFVRLLHEVSLKQPPKCVDLHVPVMATEVLESFNPKPGQTFIDMTFGAGGHTKKLLNSCPDITVIALDRDDDSYQLAMNLNNECPGKIIPLLGKFSELPNLLKEQNIKPNSIDGILFDFGCSSMQFDRAERGFSISKNGPLDMRMNKNRNQPTAADVLAKIDEPDLVKIIKIYGEEKQAKKIARAIIDIRYSLRKLETTKELADLIQSCFTEDMRFDKLQRPAHIATKTFQALRIFVNDELNEINYGMIIADKYLKVNGRLVTITFHSLEDTIVKRHLAGNLIGTTANPLPLKYSSHSLVQDREMINTLVHTNWQQVYKHVLVPKTEELDRNPRSRSAKLRAAIKIE